MAWQNGLYRANSQGSGDPISFLLRVDLSADASVGSYVSMDLYNGFMLPSTDPDMSPVPDNVVYLCSLRSQSLGSMNPGPDVLTVDLGVQTPGSLGVGPAVIRLQFQRAQNPANPYHVFYQALDAGTTLPFGPMMFLADFLGAYFHEVVLTVDTTPDFPKPYSVEANAGQLRPSFVDCFKRAGINIIGPGAADDLLPQRTTWTMRNLVDQENGKPVTSTNGQTLQVYLMIATILDGSTDTMGMMFDKYRRGATAVFYGSLQQYFGSNGRDDERDTNYLFTAVHEVAHCLNLPHAFEADRLPGLSSDIATFMNYPQDYTGGGDASIMGQLQGVSGWNSGQTTMYRKFWSSFGYSFHPQELLELRHGARPDVATGNKVSQYRGQFSGLSTSMSVGGPAGTGLVLSLRFRGKDRPGQQTAADRIENGADDSIPRALFDFGEPIHIEAELHNCLKKVHQINRRLSPLTGDLQIHYQTPGKQFLTYQPPAALCAIPRSQPLGGSGRRARNSFHKDVCLNIGGNSFKFLEPGLYRVRASYRFGDTQLISNILEVYVRYPSPEVENLVVPLLDDEVATYLAFRGVSGLSRARDRMRAAFLDDDDAARADVTHPLQNYFHAYETMLRLDESAENRDTDDHRLFANSLGLRTLTALTHRTRAARIDFSGLPFSNIALTKIGSQIYEALKPGEPALASALRGKLDGALQARGVPDQVRTRYLSGPFHK